MCRVAGRRCPCDTSEARQARRRAAKLRGTYGGAVQPAGKPHPSPAMTENATAETEAKQVTPVEPEAPRDEQLKAEAQALLKDLPNYGGLGGSATNTDESIVRLGSVVDELSYEYGAPTDEEMITAIKEHEDTIVGIREEQQAYNLELGALHTEYAQSVIDERGDEIKHSSVYQVLGYMRANHPDDPGYIAYKSEVEKINEKVKGTYTAMGEAQDKLQSTRTEMFERRNAGVKKALEEVGVQFADPNSLKVGAKTNKQALASLHDALTFFPQSWVDNSNKAVDSTDTPLVVKSSKGRAHYMDRKLQKTSSYTSFSVVSAELKDKDWTPDPLSKRDSEYEEIPDGGWVDPAVKDQTYKHEGYTSYDRETKKQWIHRQYDYLPSGSRARKGYEPVTVRKESYVSGQGWVVSDETEVLYRKPRVKRRQSGVSYNRIAELTVNGAGTTGAMSPGTRVAMHEFSHRVESHSPDVLAMQRAFLSRRAGLHTDNPEPLTRIAHHGAKEKGYKDSFPHHYMGKTYDGRNFEVLSMGMESLFSGTNGGFIGEGEYSADPEYKKFIIGVLASSAKKF